MIELRTCGAVMTHDTDVLAVVLTSSQPEEGSPRGKAPKSRECVPPPPQPDARWQPAARSLLARRAPHVRSRFFFARGATWQLPLPRRERGFGDGVGQRHQPRAGRDHGPSK